MRVGIIGLATRYYPMAIGRALRERKDVELLAAATIGATDAAIRHHIEMSAAQYADELGLKLYRDPKRMVAEERLDTVVICTRHSQHARWAERMAALGMDIYMPKTFATTLARAERIVRAQQAHGVRIAVGPTARHLPVNAAAIAAVTKGVIGKPFALRVAHHHGTIDTFGPDDWYRDPREGGPELSLGWYVIDMVLPFLGSEVESVFAQYGNYSSPGSPFMDCGKIVLRAAGGTIASCDLYFCNRFPYPSWELEVAGPEGIVKVHPTGNAPGELVASLFAKSGVSRLEPPTGLPKAWEIAWVDAFLNNTRPDPTAEDALKITKLCLAARDSARKGRAVRLR